MQHDFLLLDRSQSMVQMGGEAVGGINAYVKELADKKVPTGVTVATFDTQSFDIIRDRITPETFKPIELSEAQPRASTPLNDAIGKIVNLANAGTPWGGQYDKVAIIIMTDGEENSSKELSVQQAKDLLEGCRKKGWQVIFLGANFDNVRQATSYNNMAGQTVSTSAVNIAGTMRSTAKMRAGYGATGQSMSYSEQFKDAVKSDQKVDPDNINKAS